MADSFSYASEPHPVWSPLAAKIHEAVWEDVGLEKVREFVHQWMKSYESAWDAASSRRCMRTEQATNQLRVRAEVIEHWAESLGLSEDDCSQRLPTLLFDPLLPELPFPELPLPLPHRRLSEPERWAVLAAIHDYYLPDEQISPWPREQLDGPVPTWQDVRDYEQHREEEKKRMAEDLAGVHYWRLVARVDELTEYDKPVVEQWLKDLAEPPQQPDVVDVIHNDTDTRLVWLAKAMLLVRDHPDWSDAKIATEVEKAPSTLSRSKEYQAAATLARGNKGERPKGYVTSDHETGLHDVEAVEPPTSCSLRADSGTAIAGSSLYREYCADCGEPIRVPQAKVGTKPRCDECRE